MYTLLYQHACISTSAQLGHGNTGGSGIAYCCLPTHAIVREQAITTRRILVVDHPWGVVGKNTVVQWFLNRSPPIIKVVEAKTRLAVLIKGFNWTNKESRLCLA